MADFEIYFPTLLKWEGGLSNDPDDHGGLTKYGIILSEWIQKGYDKNGDGKIDSEDLKLITIEDASKIAKLHYWDVLKADTITSQSVAELLVDFAYNSGVVTAAKKIQSIVGVTIDGKLGNKSLSAINSFNAIELFTRLKDARIRFYNAIVQNNPSQKKFLKGWMNRVNSFKFKS